MKSKLFLIRRENREFIGPMSIEDLRRRLTRMEFGMQDEVSGHCGPWVVLDQKEELTLHYPDIAGLIGEGLPLSWRETTGHARVISKQDSRKDRAKISPKKEAEGFSQFLRKQRRKSKVLKTSSVVLVALAVLVAGFILTRKDDLPSVNEMTVLAGKSDPTDFLNIMGMKVIPHVSKIAKSQKNSNSWLPLLRLYAFYTTGVIEGFPQKLLRGDLGANAPSDCSVESWKKKWRENASQIVQTVQGRSFQKNQWTKLLFTDPHWIKRRAVKGWIKPRNFYEGCVMTASLAIRSLAGEANLGGTPQDGVTPEVVAVVSRRIQSQLELISLGKLSSPFDKASLQVSYGPSSYVLNALTCLESQNSFADLESCRITSDPQFKGVLDEHYVLALLRVVAMSGSSVLDADIMAELQANGAKLTAEDSVSKLDQSAEFKLLGQLLNGSPVDQAINKTEQECIDVKLRM